jgi:hypothetical protein
MGRTFRWMAVLFLLVSAACAPESILAPEIAPEPASAALDVKPADASEGAAMDEKPAEPAAAQVVTRLLDSIGASPGETLYIVDGVPRSGPPDIQALDIQEIQVLKGTTSPSVHGTRTSSRVVVIIATRADYARRGA